MNAISRAVFTTLYFFVTYKWDTKARAFLPSKSLWASVTKHSSSLGPFLSYETMKYCEDPNLTIAQKGLPVKNAVAFLCPFVSFKENK